MRRILFCSICFCLLMGIGGMPLHGQLPPGASYFEAEVFGAPAPGHIFIAPRSNDPSYTIPSTLMLLDSAGELIWYAPITNDTAAPYQTIKVTDFKPLADGTLAFFQPAISNADQGNKYFILDQTMSVIDSVTCTGFFKMDEHDLVLDDDGNYIVLCDTIVMEDTGGLTTNSGLPGSPNAQVLQQVVQKQNPMGNVIWEWYSLDHQPIENSDTAYFYSPGWLDHTHMNSVFENEAGKILTSSRNLNEVTLFDPLTGDIVWRLGGDSSDFTIVGDTEFFSSQHDANFTPDGNVSLFDNGTISAHEIARYVEYELDTVNWTATLVREHRHPKDLRSMFMGNAIHLENGHVILSWGGVFPQDSTVDIAEIRPDGSVAMEIDIREDFLTYRVHKEVLDWKLPRPVLTCDDNAMTLSAPAGHQSYWWNTYETTQTIVVSNPGTYQVWVDQGIGFMASEPVTVDDVSDICIALNGVEPVGSEMSFGPNPTDGELVIGLPLEVVDGWRMEVFDGLGRLVFGEEGNSLRVKVEMEKWPAGVYVVRVEGNGKVYRGRVLRR